MDEPSTSYYLPVVHVNLASGVAYGSWDVFMGNTTFKGVYKPKNGIISSQRDLVKAMGRTLRCEGVVEYAHEWYGIRIYGTDSALFSQVAHWDVTWGNVMNMDHHSGTAITPKSQAQDYMTQVISYPPTGTYKIE